MSRTKHILSYSIPIVILLFFLFGSFFAPHDPTATNIRGKYLSSSAEYPFGTDALGRCILSRILYGGWTTLGIVLGGSLIVFLLGNVIGMVTSRAVMKENALIDGLINAVTAIPPIAYLIVFIGAWGSGAKTTLVALTVSYILRYIKLVRTRTDMEMGKAYVMCNRFRRFKAQNHADSYFPEFDCRNDSLSVPFLCGYDSGYYRIFLYWIRAW